MRRRQTFAARYPAEFGSFAGALVNTPAPIVAAPLEPARPKKTCPKCGRQLGQGGHFHVKACMESNAKVGRHFR